MPQDAVTLRPALAGDLDGVARIWHAGASLPGVGPAALPPLEALRRRIDAELEAGWVLTVAEHQGEILGFIALRPDHGILDQLFVRPDGLGSGTGKALFAHAQAVMPDGFTLFTRPSNARACRFYAAQGMTVLRRETHPKFGDPIVFYAWKPD